MADRADLKISGSTSHEVAADHDASAVSGWAACPPKQSHQAGHRVAARPCRAASARDANLPEL